MLILNGPWIVYVFPDNSCVGFNFFSIVEILQEVERSASTLMTFGEYNLILRRRS